MHKKVRLSVRIDRKLSDRLELHAGQAGCSKSAYAVAAITHHFDAAAKTLRKANRAQAKKMAQG